MKKLFTLTKTLIVVAMLGVGGSAWGQVTSYSNDYEDETPNVDWISGNTGRYTVAVEGDANHYLHVASVSGGDNGTTITCSATNGKVTAGTDFYMSFDLILEGCNSSGRSSYFYVYDKNNSSSTPILKIQQNNGGNYTGWTINDNTALTTGGKGTGNWYNYVLTRIGTKEYLTVTKKSNSTKVLDMVELTNLSSDGGLGKMTFETNRYYAGLYVDNVVLRALVAPAFTLSTTEVTPEVDGSATVDVTGITGTVSVSSDNTSVATASYNDGTITINGVANGVAYITVTAVNDGAKTTQTITATVGAVATTTVTVNYLCGGSPIAEATTIEDVAIGSALTSSDITYSETIAGVGCRYVNPSFSVNFPYTVEENGIINITYTQQNAVSSLNVYANVNSTNYLLKSYELDGKYVGDAVTVTCPQYYLLNGTLYSTANHGSGGYFKWNHTLTGSNLEINYGTTAATNVVYYVEAENISGATANSDSNADIRCSEATGAYFGSETNIVTLPAGSYTIYTQVWGNSGTTFTFKAGEETIREHTTTGALNPGNSSFILAESKTITVSATGSNGKVLDLVYIVKNGEVATLGTNGYATFASPYPLDLANLPDGLTAYKAAVSGSTVTFTELNQTVPANTGILLQGEASGSYNIPVVASGTAVTENAFLVNEGGTTFTGDVDYYYFGLKKNTLTFGTFDPSSVAIPASKAYLKVLKSSIDTSAAARLSIIFNDETTGVVDVRSKMADVRGGYYNLSGQRVDQPQKGLYIVNGKKVIVK